MDTFWTWLPLAVIVVVAVLAIRRFGMPPWWTWGGGNGNVTRRSQRPLVCRAGNRTGGELARGRSLGKRERQRIGYKSHVILERFARANHPLACNVQGNVQVGSGAVAFVASSRSLDFVEPTLQRRLAVKGTVASPPLSRRVSRRRQSSRAKRQSGTRRTLQQRSSSVLP